METAQSKGSEGGFRVWDLGVWGFSVLGFRVLGFGFRV